MSKKKEQLNTEKPEKPEKPAASGELIEKKPIMVVHMSNNGYLIISNRDADINEIVDRDLVIDGHQMTLNDYNVVEQPEYSSIFPSIRVWIARPKIASFFTGVM